MLVAGCAMLQDMRAPTVEDLLYEAESVYMSQRLDYLTYFSYNPETKKYTLLPWVSESEKEILRTRERILRDAEQAIDIYRGYVRAGKVPTVEVEQKLITFIRQFSRKGG
jgi:hypothetical protein